MMNTDKYYWTLENLYKTKWMYRPDKFVWKGLQNFINTTSRMNSNRRKLIESLNMLFLRNETLR